MVFKRIKTPGIAHAAYLFGDKGDAAVVDPRRDIEEYLQTAHDNKLSIKYVFETHLQEDFVLGSTAIAKVTGAKVINGRHHLFGRGDIRLADGEEFSFGSFKIQALHTPGHTPESMCYSVCVAECPDRVWGVFTGDTLFIGETGRTDLSDPKKTAENAGLLYDAIHQKLLPLGDQVLVFPAHGSGSVCGGDISERDDSTLGLERGYNPVFVQSRREFMESKVNERIPRPPYFAYMEEVNRKGGIPLAMASHEVRVLQAKEFQREMPSGIVIDGRDPEAYAGGHIPNSYSIWAGGLSVFGGWVANHRTKVFLVLANSEDLKEAHLSLARIGIDEINGVLAGGFESWRNAGFPIACSGATTVRALKESMGNVHVLDVRDDSEFEEEGHIRHASHLYVGYLEEHLNDVKPLLDRSKSIAVTCSVGHRASLAASMLRRRGFKNVDNLLGGMTAWENAGLPKQRGRENSVTTTDIEGVRV